MKRHNNLIALVLMPLLLLACSTTSQNSVIQTEEEETAIYDPFEETNREIFAFNAAFDDKVLHPTLKGYRAVVPVELRNGLNNFLVNLRTPMVLGNELLQGDVEGARIALLRGVINTMVGFGGFFDFAGKEGMPHQSEDFGQTLAVWGFDHGPYLVVPFIGPSSTRDYIGYIVELYADPLRFYLYNIDEDHWNYARAGLDYLRIRNDLMDTLEDLRNNSIDYYASTRSIYYQRRAAQIADGKIQTQATDDLDIPDYDE